jgi:hypothetical protein
MRPTFRKRNSLLSSFACLVSTLRVRPFWRGRRQTVPPIPSAAVQALLGWPPSWPDLTLRDSFLWGYVKVSVFLPPVPQDVPEQLRKIIAAISELDRHMLQRVWAEMGYRIDVSRHKGRTNRALMGYPKETWRISFSICRLQVTILSVIQVYRFYEMCQGVMDNPVRTRNENLTLRSRCRQHSVMSYCNMLFYVGEESKKECSVLCIQGCGVGVVESEGILDGVGVGLGVGKNVPTPTPTSI